MRGRRGFEREVLGKTEKTVHLPRARLKVRGGTGAFASTLRRKPLHTTTNALTVDLLEDRGFGDRLDPLRHSSSAAHRILRGIPPLRAFLSLSNRRLDPIVPAIR